MPDKQLFILLEGDDDKRFFETILKPLLQRTYSTIKCWKYSQKKHENIARFIKTLNSMNADYIFARDINNAPCITSKRDKITRKFNQIPETKIIVVVKEIESWYLAGLDKNTSKKCGIRKKIGTTDNITKEHFNHLIPRNMPRTDFIQKILENYDVEIAKERCESFGYFLNKWC